MPTKKTAAAKNDTSSSVWSRPKRSKREQPTLSREQIVAAALRILDTEGSDALSMRRLGTELGAVATAIYWHVSKKDDLIELVIDEVYGEITVPEPTDASQWQAAATECSRSIRAAILRHPWLASVLDVVGLASEGPNMMRLADRILGIFATGGFALVDADKAMKALIAYVTGLTATEAAMLSKLHQLDQQEIDHLTESWPAATQAVANYPHLSQLYREIKPVDPQQVREEYFEYGLARFLDGLQSQLDREK